MSIRYTGKNVLPIFMEVGRIYLFKKSMILIK